MNMRPAGAQTGIITQAARMHKSRCLDIRGVSATNLLYREGIRFSQTVRFCG